MTTYSFDSLQMWVNQTQEDAGQRMGEAVSNMFRDIEIVPGLNLGGSRIRGTIPYETTELAESLKSHSSSGVTSVGRMSWAVVAANIRPGDYLSFEWGYGPDHYAKWVHDGANGIPGTYWVVEAAAKWPSYVAAAFGDV